jgi:DNA-binding response OmpR family regulator
MNKSVSQILLVEDEPNLGMVLKDFLEMKGYQVILKTDGISGREAALKENFDCLLLDVMLPGVDSFAVCKEIRQHKASIPILLLTARGRIEDKIAGFGQGADDYLTKPFSPVELLLRIEALCRRFQQQLPDVRLFKIGKYQFDTQNRILVNKGNSIKLTSKEADLLKLLGIHANRLLSREKILQQIGENDDIYTARSMDVYITGLRKYLKEDNSIEIMNTHVAGYQLNGYVSGV